MEDAKPTFYNKPALGAFDTSHEDFKGHEMEYRWDNELQQDYFDFTNGRCEVPLGVIRSEDLVEIIQQPDGRTWVHFTCVLWAKYAYRQVKRLLKDSKKKISVEIEVLESHKDENDVEVIDKFVFDGFTILGSSVTEAIPNAHLTILDKINDAVYQKQEKCLSFAYKELNNDSDTDNKSLNFNSPEIQPIEDDGVVNEGEKEITMENEQRGEEPKTMDNEKDIVETGLENQEKVVLSEEKKPEENKEVEAADCKDTECESTECESTECESDNKCEICGNDPCTCAHEDSDGNKDEGHEDMSEDDKDDDKDEDDHDEDNQGDDSHENESTECKEGFEATDVTVDESHEDHGEQEGEDLGNPDIDTNVLAENDNGSIIIGTPEGGSNVTEDIHYSVGEENLTGDELYERFNTLSASFAELTEKYEALNAKFAAKQNGEFYTLACSLVDAEEDLTEENATNIKAFMKENCYNSIYSSEEELNEAVDHKIADALYAQKKMSRKAKKEEFSATIVKNQNTLIDSNDSASKLKDATKNLNKI